MILFETCKILGRQIGIDFKLPNDLDTKKPQEEKIRAICLESQVEMREVLLKKNWWKKDSLSLLGFLNDEPVALIRRKKRYFLVQPNEKKWVKLKENIASKLSKRAFLFYPTFPDHSLSGLELVKFAIGKNLVEILSIFLIGVGGALLSLIPPALTKTLFDRVVNTFDSTLLPGVILGMIAATLSIGIFVFVRSISVLRLMQLIDIRLESSLWSRLLSLPVNFFRKWSVGNLIQRVYALSEIRNIAGVGVIRALFSGLFSLFYFFAMLYFSISLTLVGVSVVLFGLVISSYCFFKKASLERKIQEQGGVIQTITLQLISGLTKLRMSGSEERGFNYFANDFSLFQKYNFKARKYDRLVTAFTTALPIFGMGLLFLSFVRFGNDAISVGTFIAFLAAYLPFSLALFDMINTALSLASVIPLWERTKVILEEKPENFGQKERGILQGGVALDRLSFKYEERGPLILNEISLKVDPEEFVAIVGPTGSGKSTLVRLLLGFEQPLTGNVFYDGKELQNLHLLEVRKQIGTVLQNGALFAGTLMENIVCGGIYTSGEIEEALNISGFDKDLQTFPMALHTFVQSGGSTLSVGQAQRLLIARALIAKPKILIFDEATSALDNKTQEEISCKLDALQVTRIVIAHRLSTIRHADRIYVMDRGSVVQVGTFHELLEQEGLFREMWRRQTL